MRVWYATLEDVKLAMDSKATAYSDRRVSRAIDGGSRSAERLLKRRFYPELITRTFDWPNYDLMRTWQLDLKNNEVISITTLTAGGTVIPSTNYFLRRWDNVDFPPYTYIEIDLSKSSAFAAGLTFQRSISILGSFGYRDEQIDTGGVLATTVNASVTTVDVTNSVETGTGSLLIIETERMLVSARSFITTGTTLTAQMDASNAFVNAAVSDGTKHFAGETILINNETMIVRRVVGNNLTVQRAQDGSVLALQGNGSTVLAPRRLTVSRGVLGTTAAGHTAPLTVNRQDYPAQLGSLVTAYAINETMQQTAGYARTAGTGDHQKEFTGRGIAQLEQDAVEALGRRNRVAAI